MAKTTKVVNKRTTGSKNSNTNNGKGFFGKSFDLKSRKVQFFVVILIVAILGGGYFTFKSFAAAYTITVMNNSTSESFNYAPQQKNQNCNIDYQNSYESSKNNLKVVSVGCNGNANPDVDGWNIWTPTYTSMSSYINTGGIRKPQITPNFYRACVTVRGGGRIKTTIWTEPYSTLYRSEGTSEKHTIANSGKYERYCSPYRQVIGDPRRIRVSGSVQVSSPNTLVVISNIQIEKEINMAGPAPAPTK